MTEARFPGLIIGGCNGFLPAIFLSRRSSTYRPFLILLVMCKFPRQTKRLSFEPQMILANMGKMSILGKKIDGHSLGKRAANRSPFCGFLRFFYRPVKR